MKKTAILCFVYLLLAFVPTNKILAQAPNYFNYQAIARDNMGAPIPNQAIAVRLTIRQNDSNGDVQYQETHNVTTNAQGLFNLKIGNGTPNLGSFSNVTWRDELTKFMQTELDPDGAGALPFTTMGNEAFNSVPYAQFAVNSRWVEVSNTNIRVGLSGYNQTGADNTGVGFVALGNTVVGNRNTALGAYAYSFGTTGSDNTALGANTLYFSTTGSGNTAVGKSALVSNTAGSNNTSAGIEALSGNTLGNGNSAFGKRALFSNTQGSQNTAIGLEALYSNTIGESNVAVGDEALYYNQTGYYNVALGRSAMYENTGGFYNTGIGLEALKNNTTGGNNAGLGAGALEGITTGDGNTGVGVSAGPFTNCSNYTAVGFTTGSLASSSNMVEIGNTSVSIIRGQVGFTTYSDARIKENIQPDVPGLAFITQLKPVTYNLNVHRQNQMMYGNSKINTTDWEGKYDIEKIRMTGFLAQEVEQAAQNAGFDFSGIVKPKNEHDLYSLRYAEFVVPLVKAVQEQQQMIAQQNQTIEQLQQQLAKMETLEAELQKIKAALQLHSH